MSLRVAAASVACASALALTFLVRAADGASSAQVRGAKLAILHVFGPRYGPAALRVSDCETGGTFSVWAGFGKHQYTGLFQLGASERRRYARGLGHWWGWWAQVKAAHRYFVLSGRDWSPWSCKP